MPTKNKCTDCKFFKKHIFFGEKDIEIIGGTCSILNKTSKTTYGEFVSTLEMEKECPLNKISEYEKFRECWYKLKSYVNYLESENSKIYNEFNGMLLDIIIKMEKLEKGE